MAHQYHAKMSALANGHLSIRRRPITKLYKSCSYRVTAIQSQIKVAT